MNEQSNELPAVERLKMARSIKQKEADHRREKRWKIFSWTSSLLIGSIGGAVAITSKASDALPWIPHKLFLVIAVIVLSGYSILWLRYNKIALDNCWKTIVEIDGKLNIFKGIEKNDTKPEDYYKFVSYGSTITLLALSAILIIVLS